MKKLTRYFLCFSLLIFSTLVSALDDRFDYVPGYEVENFNTVDTDRDYTKYEGSIITANPLSGEDYRSKFHYYETTKDGEHPLLIILPPIGGVNTVDKSIASYMANRGVNVLIALTPEDIADVNRPVDDIDGFLIRTTVSARHLIDFATDRNKVDASRIGGFGASLGGIRLLTLIGVDERISASVIYVGAGNIPEILANSEQDIIKNYREYKMRELQVETREEYLDLMRANSTVEPLDNVHNFDADNVYLKISNRDTSVPTANQWETQNAIGTQNYNETNRNHVQAIIAALFERGQIKKFFTDRWQ